MMVNEDTHGQEPANPSIDWKAVFDLIRQMKDHSDVSSQSSSDKGEQPPTTGATNPFYNRSRQRRKRKNNKATNYNDKHPQVAIEVAESQASGNPQGRLSFNLTPPPSQSRWKR